MKMKRKHSWPIIHIIGLPGAGKTTLGKQLSKKLGLPVFYIGTYRARHAQTGIGEADAWVALFRDLSRRGWENCILETTGLNSRAVFLQKALPLDQMVTIKLEASKKTLHRRIGLKKKREQGGDWLFSQHLPDKITFVNRFYRNFQLVSAHISIDTEKMTKAQVFRAALKEINGSCYELLVDV